MDLLSKNSVDETEWTPRLPTLLSSESKIRNILSQLAFSALLPDEKQKAYSIINNYCIEHQIGLSITKEFEDRFKRKTKEFFEKRSYDFQTKITSGKFEGQTHQDFFNLVSQAYESIELDRLAFFLGLEVNSAEKVVRQSILEGHLAAKIDRQAMTLEFEKISNLKIWNNRIHDICRQFK